MSLVELSGAAEALKSPDPALRDATAFARIEQDVGLGGVPVAEAAYLVDVLEPMMFEGIGSSGDDSVFGRSFAVLSLGICVYRDNNEPYLEQTRWFELLGATEAYALREIDLRGWVPGKGWAHAAAHTADLIGRFAKSRYASAEAVGPRLLDIASALQRNATDAFAWGEDERLARALATGVELGTIPVEALLGWARTAVERAPVLDYAAFDPVSFARRENLKRLLRALHLRLDGVEELRALQGRLLDF